MKDKKGQPKPFLFLKEIQRELKKATWPSRQETIRLTSIVVFVSLVVASFIGFLDFSFTKLVGIVIKR